VSLPQSSNGLIAACSSASAATTILRHSSGNSPAAKVEHGESLEQALARELREELDVTLLRLLPISYGEHSYGGGMGTLLITFFAVSILESELHPGPFERVAWVLPRELGDYDFLTANRRLIAELATGRIKPAELLAASPATPPPPTPPPEGQ